MPYVHVSPTALRQLTAIRRTLKRQCHFLPTNRQAISYVVAQMPAFSSHATVTLSLVARHNKLGATPHSLTVSPSDYEKLKEYALAHAALVSQDIGVLLSGVISAVYYTISLQSYEHPNNHLASPSSDAIRRQHHDRTTTSGRKAAR